MQKIILKIFISLLILGFQSFNVLAFYEDVPETHEYYKSIKNLYELGRLPVEADNQFHPDDLLTKAELYKLILTYGMATLSDKINLPFSDIDSESAYAVYIQTAIDTQILKPSSEENRFNPDKKIQKKIALSIMFNSLGQGANYFFPKEDFPFTDIQANSIYAPIAFKAHQLKILEKKNPKKFRKNKKISKAEAVDYLNKIRENSLAQTFSITLTPVKSGNITAPNDIHNNPSFNTLLDVWSSLKQKYLYRDKIKDDALIFNAIKGLVTELDDKYTVFEKPSEKNGILVNLGPNYEGIGIIIELIEKKVTIISPFRNSPAEKAGLKAKDIIVKIDGQNIAGQTLEEVSAKIKGPAKSEVKLTVKRGNQELEFSVIRDSITVKSVIHKIITTSSGKNVAHISLINFGQGTYEEFLAIAKELKKENLAGLIIDLRNNPGGFVDSAVNILSLFTDEVKTAVKFENADKKMEEFKTNGNGTLKDYKTVLIINEGSASASEILAGALQDYQRAKIIGTKSFGKGTAQELRQYKDGSILKYTVSHWLTPNGRTIENEGIIPDKIIENSGIADNQLDAALSEF